MGQRHSPQSLQWMKNTMGNQSNNASRNALEPLAYSINEACHVSSLGRTYVYLLIKQGKLKTLKIGRRTLIPAASLRDLIEGGEQ